VLAGKGTGLMVGGGDVLYWNWSPAGGFGDPLTRDPALVAADVAEGGVTDEGADRVYGVVLRAGAVDEEHTARLREQRLLRRMREAGAALESLPPVREVPADAETIADVYVINRADDRLECFRCGSGLGAVTDDPKQGMVVVERPVSSLSPGAPDPSVFVDDDVIWRDLLCPGCGVRLATEVAYPGAPLFREIELT
jgi:N-methylhydantoinase B